MASITIIFGGKEQQTFALNRPRMVVGREPSSEIHIDNLGISRQQCAFVLKGEVFLVQDLGSANGTYVNGRKVTEYNLNDNDEVVIGKYTLKFHSTKPGEAPVMIEAPAEAKAAAPAQPAAPAPGGPEALDTYVMDGKKIQEQLARMRQGSLDATPQAPVKNLVTAKDFAQAMDVPGQAGAKSNGLIVGLLVLIAILLVGIIALIIFMRH